jgi:hypothetical protein
MRYVRILLLVVVGMVPAMRSGFSAQVKSEDPDEFGRSPATGDEEKIRAALLDAAQVDDARKVKKLLDPLTEDIERLIGLFAPNEPLKITSWLSAANRLSVNVL